MKSVLLSLIAWSLLFSSYVNAAPEKKNPSSWIKPINEIDESTADGATGYQYLLYDVQDNLSEEEGYRHYVLKVLNTEGIQDVSDISVSFDPTYQKLSFHKIIVKRDGQRLDKLKDAEINVFQRESNMESSLYDGTETAVIHLGDIRSGDIIEYSYTVKGFNPINKGHYQKSYYTQLTTPVNQINIRILSPSKLQYKLFNDAPPPVFKESGGAYEYQVNRVAKDYLLYDNNVPSWYDALSHISFSTHEDWSSVVNWALPLYEYNQTSQPKFDYQSIEKDRQLLEAIRMVQDDVRYLGLEEGIGAYKPHNPDQVFQQRYGDCKDKSLLLVSLMRDLGLEAYPVLVNTVTKGEMYYQLPANIFNHCVVGYFHDEEWKYVDPTISSQGGDLDHLYFPDYGYGLLIKEGESKLTKLPKPEVATIFISEVIEMEGVDGGAGLHVKSRYTGERADYMRRYFGNSSTEVIQKEFLNFYSALYPDIELAEELRFTDDSRNGENNVLIEEFYHVPSIWQYNETSEMSYVEVYPLVLENMVFNTKSAARDMPYYLGSPISFSQVSILELTESWPFEPVEKVIEGPGFRYENTVSGIPTRIEVAHHYTLINDFIEGDQVGEFSKKHTEIQNELSYNLTRFGSESGGFQLSWISVVIFGLTLLGSIWGAFKVYREYDPAPWEYAEDKSIGGWLVLPAIGITISPIYLCFSIFDPDLFNRASWIGAMSLEEGKVDMLLLFSAELIYNVSYLVLSILVVVLFYARRTSLPRVITIFYVVSVVGPTADILLAKWVLGNELVQFNDEDTKQIVRSVVSALIWIPYFQISERVKSTFCKTLRD